LWFPHKCTHTPHATRHRASGSMCALCNFASLAKWTEVKWTEVDEGNTGASSLWSRSAPPHFHVLCNACGALCAVNNGARRSISYSFPHFDLGLALTIFVLHYVCDASQFPCGASQFVGGKNPYESGVWGSFQCHWGKERDTRCSRWLLIKKHSRQRLSRPIKSLLTLWLLVIL